MEWHGRLDDDAVANEDSGLDEGDCSDEGVDVGIDVERVQDRMAKREKR